MTHLLLWFFPGAWRSRYGQELTDLVSETGLTPRVAADLARAGTKERVRAARAALNGGASMIFGPAWRHPTAWAVAGAIVLLPTAAFLAVSIAMPDQLDQVGGLGIFSDVEGLLIASRWVDLAVVVAPAFAALLAALPLVRIGITRQVAGSEASLSVRLRAANIAVVVVGLGVAGLLVGHILFESVMQIGA